MKRAGNIPPEGNNYLTFISSAGHSLAMMIINNWALASLIDSFPAAGVWFFHCVLLKDE